MLRMQNSSHLSTDATVGPIALGLASATSPFIRSLQLVAANRADVRGKRPTLPEGTSSFVRFAVLNLMRSR